MEYLKHARSKSKKERYNTNYFGKTQNQNKAKQLENGRKMRLQQLPQFIDMQSFRFIDMQSFNFMESLKNARSKLIDMQSFNFK
jgi:hypothetical protein